MAAPIDDLKLEKDLEILSHTSPFWRDAWLHLVEGERPTPHEVILPETPAALAQCIDHTALHPTTTEEAIRKLCDEAIQFGFASVCVSPCFVALAYALLEGHPTRVGTVISFPHGTSLTRAKVAEATLALEAGAQEFDMVMPVGFLKGGQYALVEQDIEAVVQAVAEADHMDRGMSCVKVILETALLTDVEKVMACVLAQRAGADYVKTSTGFSTTGATAADVALMRRVVGFEIGVKASGGIRTPTDAQTLIQHGASRLGTSGSVALVQGWPPTPNPWPYRA